MANIAEGNDAQTNRQFAAFLSYAKRSAAETRSHIYAGYDRGYFSELDFNECLLLAKKIARQLSNLMRYLRSASTEKRQIFSCNLQPATDKR